jgi:hypothetical protein
MRPIRHVLQLHFGAHASARVIAREVGVGRSTVQDYLTRATAAALNWPLAPELTDEVLERLLFPSPSSKPGARHYPEPDWAELVREMKRPGVNLSVLFEEYQEVHPEGCAGRRIRHLRPVQIATAGRLNSPPEAGEFATPDRRHRAVRRGRTVADKQLYLARRETVN